MLFFCKVCKSYQPASMDHQITKVGNHLILHLKRFVNHDGHFIKDITKVHCTKTLSVPLVVNENSFHKKFSLIATVNHKGTLNRGHYTVFIKQPSTSSWLFCNDAAVFRSSVKKTILLHISTFMKPFKT